MTSNEFPSRSVKSLRLAGIAGAVMLVFAAATSTAASGPDFSTRLDVPPLKDSIEWVLWGKKLSNGACRYEYPSTEAEVPESGWVVRSVAIDMDWCAKLFEEGTPTYELLTDQDLTVVEVSGEEQPEPSSEEMALAASTRAAWQWVGWKDAIGLTTTSDTTEIEWTYNGSTVTSGQVSSWISFLTTTGWGPVYAYKSGTLEATGDYYLGNSWSKFRNNFFCAPFPTVYTYYYHNKMWGHPNGTATRSQSSDSVDECAPLHVEIYSAYGQYSP